jgi:hypothetical protein
VTNQAGLFGRAKPTKKKPVKKKTNASLPNNKICVQNMKTKKKTIQ